MRVTKKKEIQNEEMRLKLHSMFDEYGDYFDPEEVANNAQTIAEIIQIAKGLLREEVKTKIKNLEEDNQVLREELASLRDFQNEKNRLIGEANRYKNEKEQEYRRGYDDCKKERLLNLLNLEYGYALTWDRDYLYEKCDKCDDDRKIHFTSPSGNDMTEPCPYCSKSITTYKVAKTKVCSWHFGDGDNPEKVPSRYYAKPPRTEYGVTKQEFDAWDSKIWCYKVDLDTFEKILAEGDRKHCLDYVFESEEDCQKYADRVNKKIREEENKK